MSSFDYLHCSYAMNENSPIKLLLNCSNSFLLNNFWKYWSMYERHILRITVTIIDLSSESFSAIMTHIHNRMQIPFETISAWSYSRLFLVTHRCIGVSGWVKYFLIFLHSLLRSEFSSIYLFIYVSSTTLEQKCLTPEDK